jgi:hypothetical protein
MDDKTRIETSHRIEKPQRENSLIGKINEKETEKIEIKKELEEQIVEKERVKESLQKSLNEKLSSIEIEKNDMKLAHETQLKYYQEKLNEL